MQYSFDAIPMYIYIKYKVALNTQHARTHLYLKIGSQHVIAAIRRCIERKSSLHAKSPLTPWDHILSPYNILDI